MLESIVAMLGLFFTGLWVGCIILGRSEGQDDV